MLKDIKSKLNNRNRKNLCESKLTKAAVLLPLMGAGQSLRVLFTKRTQSVHAHKGQISFPGGHFEEYDSDLKNTALRETFEEVGIDENEIEIIGTLDDTETITDYVITPFVGHIKTNPQYKIARNEIERIIEIPLEFIMDEKNWRQKEHRMSDIIYKGFSFTYKNDRIWGATAQILKKFIDIIK